MGWRRVAQGWNGGGIEDPGREIDGKCTLNVKYTLTARGYRLFRAQVTYGEYGEEHLRGEGAVGTTAKSPRAKEARKKQQK